MSFKWQKLKIWKNINRDQFIDYKWQTKNIISNANLNQFMDSLELSEEIRSSIQLGIKKSPMTVKIPPYLISQIDWDNFWNDPIRKQFLPVKEEIYEDHPKLKFDSLGEQHTSPVKGLIHRYPNKVLFLALSICPLYCRFCTRAYSVGTDTEISLKQKFAPTKTRYDEIFKYLNENTNVEDVTLSGGDAYLLDPELLRFILTNLLEIKHIKRIRIGTKGLCAMPMKILTHTEWTETFISLSNYARENCKQLAIHTHFNHPNEISEITQEACNLLYRKGVIIRNQTVLLREVNDNTETILLLIKKLIDMNVFPYYLFQSDMTVGTEYFRTPLKTLLDLEKNILGTNSGFMLPKFMIDLPGGGGKRTASSFEYYNIEKGESCYKSPSISNEKLYYYYDPLIK